MENVCFQKEEGQEETNVTSTVSRPVSLAGSKSTQHVFPSRSSSSVCHNTLRRIPVGMGGAYGQEDSLRQMVLCHGSMSYKLLGTTSCLPEPSRDQPSKRCTHSPHLRQQSSSGLYKKRRIQIHSSKLNNETDYQPQVKEKLVPIREPSFRHQKCSSRLVVQERSSVNRMELRQDVIPLHQVPSTSSGGRLVCHKSKPSSTKLCIPVYGPERSGSGCLSAGLEQMEDCLSVSSNSNDFEGFNEAERIPRNSLPSGPELAFQPLVSHAATELPDYLPSEVSATVPSSEEQDMLRFILSEPRPTRLDFIKRCYSKKYPPAVTDLLVQKLRGSTVNQYESTWKLFLKFLHSKLPSKLTEGLVLEFFTVQFQQMGRKPATIRTYKSALEKPLRLGFDIVLHDSDFSDIVRAMARLVPAERSPTISWSLNKVLALLSSPDYSGPEVTESRLLSKAVFLVSLACGSRVSEVSALMRGKSHIVHKESGQLLLFPSRTFLAKNEDPMHRRPPIQLWKLDDNNPLCPVSALQRYLKATNRVQSDSLFVKPGTCKPLSIKGLTQNMVSLIKLADPNSFPHFHDIRKYATTLAFLGDATLEELARYTGWRSIQVFLKHYRKQIEDLRYKVQAAGTIVPNLSGDE